jgi:hypothetical protein
LERKPNRDKTIKNSSKKNELSIKQNLKMSHSSFEFRITNSAQYGRASQMPNNKDFNDLATLQSAIFGLLIELPLNYNK